MASRALPSGKLPAALMRSLLDAGPPLPPEVRLGPALGEDACALDLPAGVLVAGTDPITLTGRDVGAHAVWINANDVAVTGVRPRWFLASVLLPTGTDEDGIRALFDGLRGALARVGAVLVGGHTEISEAVNQPVVVGVMLGLREDGRFVATGGLGAGDVVLQIGPAALEGAAVLASEAAQRLDPALCERARAGLEDPGISVVEPALLCAELGATALHDPTEGGLATGLAELAEASGLRLRIEPGAALWFEPAPVICRAVGADPWGVLSSGTLLAGFSPGSAGEARTRLEARGWQVRELGRAEPGRGVVDGRDAPLATFERDEVARVLASASGAKGSGDGLSS